MLRYYDCLATTLTLATTSATLAQGELNMYSSRHYDTDERFYSEFEIGRAHV